MAFLGRWLVRLGRHRRLAPLRRYARQTGLFEWYLPFERYLLLGQAADSGDPDIMLFVDEPTLSGAMLPPDVQDDLAIMGWALGMSPIEAVTVDVDGVPMGAAFLGLPRADVKHAHKRFPSNGRDGFVFKLSYESLQPGQRRVGITARTKSGALRTIRFVINVVATAGRTMCTSVRRKVAPAERSFICALIERMRFRPHIVVLIATTRTDLAALPATLSSLTGQIWRSFTVVVSGDPSSIGGTPDLVAEVSRLGDKLLLFPDEHVLTAMIQALDSRDLVLNLAAGDIAAVDALFEYAWHAVQEYSPDLLYADDVRVDPVTDRTAVFFKPSWSPTLLLSTGYIGSSWCTTAALFQQALGESPAGPSCSLDRLLRCAEQAKRVTHIPKVLHASGGGDADSASELGRAIMDSLRRRGVEATVDALAMPGVFRLRPTLPSSGLVSIIIPTCAARGLIGTCLDSLRARTTYRHFEIICIDNVPAAHGKWKSWISANADIVVPIDEPFNWARFNNIAAEQASGQYLLFLNDDIEIVQPDWLEALIETLALPQVGVVGAQLRYPGGRVQHAGIFLTEDGIGRHAFRLAEPDDPGPFGKALAAREVTAVTGACLLTRKSDFFSLQGFDDRLAVVYNDVDYCLRAAERGLRCVYTPAATLVHHEKASRLDLPEASDFKTFRQRWSRTILSGDPFFHEMLDGTLDHYAPQSEPTLVSFPSRPVYSKDEVQRIIAIKVDHIGDFITSFPALRKLKAAFPRAELAVLCAPASAHLAYLEPAIDRVVVHSHFHARSQLGKVETGPDAISALQRELSHQEFDLAVDLRKHPDTRELLLLTNAGVKAGFDFLGQFPWIDIALAWTGDHERVRKHQHITDDLINLVDAIVHAGDESLPQLDRGPNWEPRQRVLLERHVDLFNRPVVCIHVGGGNENKLWPARKFAGFIEVLLATENVNVALVGGADEAVLARTVIESLGPSERVHLLLGELDLSDLPMFIDACALFVGNNSGPQHIAATLGVPTICVHSGVVDPREFGPLGRFVLAIHRKTVCAPCFRAREDCHRELACLTGVHVSLVVNAARRMLRLEHGVFSKGL